MAVIIRLQNLPWSANAMDIRQFFAGLNVPDGGVHIVGGEKGDAFIAFSTDEDARQAMNRSGERLNNVAVKLLLSSKTEMQTVIAAARGVPLSAVPGMAGFANLLPPNADAFGPGFGSPPPGPDFGGPFPENPGMMGPDNANGPWGDQSGMGYLMDPMGGGFNGEPVMGDMNAMPGPMSNMGPSPFMDNGPNGRGQKRNFSDMSDSCCFVSNMPPSINYRDVRRLFSGLEIPRDGLRIINDEQGSRVGDAFVRFASSEYADKAASYGRWEMDGQPVFVERCPLQMFESAIDSFVPSRKKSDYPPDVKRRRSNSSPPAAKKQLDTTCAAIKNLPYDCVNRDLFRFFSGLKFAKGDASVHIENRPDGLPSGIALIEFTAEKDLTKATRMFGELLSGRPIEIHPIPKEEYERRVGTSDKLTPPKPRSERRPKTGQTRGERGRELKREKMSPDREHERDHSNNGDDRPRRRSSTEPSPKRDQIYYCVQLFGLPFSCSYRTVEQFFSGLSIAKRGVHLITLANGKTGPAGFVEFATPEDCDKAVQRHKAYMGQRYIEVKQVTKMQMQEELQKLKRKESHKREPSPRPSVMAGSQPDCVVRIANLHPSATLEDIGQFFRGFAPIMSSVKIRYVNGLPTGDAMLEFCTGEDAQGAVRRMNGESILGRPVRLCLS